MGTITEGGVLMHTVYCDRIVDYYVPYLKHEAVNYLVQYKGYKRITLEHLPKKVVLAIYHKVRRA